MNQVSYVKMKGFKTGDYVYYYDQEGNTIPAKILIINPTRIKIYGNFIKGNCEVWVKAQNLELQESKEV